MTEEYGSPLDGPAIRHEQVQRGQSGVRGRETLDLAYRATSYVASEPGGQEIRIRVGEESPDLNSLLQAHGVTSCAFLTPCNPRSEPLSDGVNAARLAALRAEMEARGFPYWEGMGVGEGTGWPPEPSLLVFGISRSEAIEMAVRYEQYAFVFGELGGCAELVWTQVAPTAG